MRRSVLSSALTAILLSAGACGDDAKNNTAPDAAPDAPANEVAFSDPEGGSLIFEYITFSTQLATLKGLPSGVTTVDRTMAYFMNAMTPELMPLPKLNECSNLYVTKGWPGGLGTATQHLDVGTITIVGKNAAGQDVMNVVPRAAAANTSTFPADDIARRHGATNPFYQAIAAPAANFIKPGSSYDVKLGGSAQFAATTYERMLYMPLHFDVLSPGLNDAVTIKAGQDFTVTWEVVNNPDAPPGTFGELIIAVVLVDPSNGAPVIFCPAPASLGTFTIPGAMISSYRTAVTANGGDPNAAVLLRNNILHSLAELRNEDAANKRRVDFLSFYCYAQIVSVNP